MSLKIGDKAPDFTAKDAGGKEISLSSFQGSKLILFFYPKDNTPGCTAEACNLRDNEKDLLSKGFAIVGVSADSEVSHKKFIDKFNLPFPIISDPDKDILKNYGVWGLKKFMGKEYMGIKRTTFVISEDGVIEKIFTKVKTKDHSGQILKEYNL